jgi:NADH:ubiquinone oxidoreductase subunit 3 (subunit A)
MNLKLNLLFIVMDVLTVLAYPIVFVHTKLSQFSKSMAGISLAHFLRAGFVPADK